MLFYGGGGRTNDAVVGKVLLGIFVDVRSMKQGLGGDATNVEAGTAELAALLNACDLTRKKLLDLTVWKSIVNLSGCGTLRPSCPALMAAT